jgi:hypothetical protein
MKHLLAISILKNQPLHVVSNHYSQGFGHGFGYGNNDSYNFGDGYGKGFGYGLSHHMNTGRGAGVGYGTVVKGGGSGDSYSDRMNLL